MGDPCVTLGWPLGHAWATQGLPNPRPNPNRQRLASLKNDTPGAKTAAPQTVIVSERDFNRESNDLNPGEACTSIGERILANC